MKKSILMLGLATLLLLLAACGGTAKPALEPAASSDSVVSVQEESAVETEIKIAAEESEPEMAESEDEMMSDAAETTDMAEEMADEAEEVVEDEMVEEEMAEEVVEAEEVAEAEEVVEAEDEVDADTAAAEAPPAVVAATDYHLISQTGRPQFFNSFTDW